MILSEETKMVLSFANIGLLIAVVWTFAKSYFSFKSDAEKKDIVVKELDNRIGDQGSRISSQDRKIVKLEDKHNLIGITQAILNTKLENIEAGIVEIKIILKNK